MTSERLRYSFLGMSNFSGKVAANCIKLCFSVLVYQLFWCLRTNGRALLTPYGAKCAQGTESTKSCFSHSSVLQSAARCKLVCLKETKFFDYFRTSQHTSIKRSRRSWANLLLFYFNCRHAIFISFHLPPNFTLVVGFSTPITDWGEKLHNV